MADPTCEVVVQIAGDDLVAGRMWSHRRGGTESATFAYSDDYLAHRAAYELDPALPLVSGPQQTPAGRSMFGAFTDCAPDGWGRRLIQRAERIRARDDDVSARSLGEIDYLLGVRDDLRQGAVRFRDPASGVYLAQEDRGAPALVDLPVLLDAAEHLDRDDIDADALQALLRGGSSLGGARPKAHVLDPNGRIAIAKFPRPTTDQWDVMRWEAVALRLAADAGIRVPAFGLHVVVGRPVLVVDRFDRVGPRRIGYASAMTMLEATDGETASYTEIGSIIEEQSPSATRDVQELWRRVAFSILISNTDDHLRNHGFLRTTTGGWELAPAFDLNPNPDPGRKHLSTAIDAGEVAARVEPLLDAAAYFRLDGVDARRVLAEVADATSGWRTVAEGVGLGQAEIDLMEPAFEHEQALAARDLRDATPAAPTPARRG
jgi:serine/threonine-protein kinase HipA